MVELAEMRIAGIALLGILALFVIEGVAYSRAKYDGAFWRLPLDEKLDHVARHPREWVWIGMTWVPLLAAAVGGLAAFSYFLSLEGEPALAWMGFGSFAVGAVFWMWGVVIQTAAVRVAAMERVGTGETPGWLQPLWTSAYWSEVAYLAAAHAAFAIWGVAIIRSGFPSPWIGWVGLFYGVLVGAGVVISQKGFPQLGLLWPVLLGLALTIG